MLLLTPELCKDGEDAGDFTDVSRLYLALYSESSTLSVYVRGLAKSLHFQISALIFRDHASA